MSTASSPSLRFSLHHATILLIVFMEYLQAGMLSFASRWVSGGIDAAPEEFSLAATCYAAVAVVMILSHRWLAQQLGYRRLLRLSLWLFALGAIICACGASVTTFIGGRMVQALGGAAFFTASRVQALHFQGKSRMLAVLSLAWGIMLGSALAPVLAAYLVENETWTALFWVMLPLVFLVDQLVRHTVPEHEPAEHEQPDRLNVGAILLLSLGIFLLQYVLERSRFDLFSDPGYLGWGVLAAAGLLLAYLWHEWRNATPLAAFVRAASNRYQIGLALYGFVYVVMAASSYMLPIFMVQGLGFAVQATGWMQGLTSGLGLLTITGQFLLVSRWPLMKRYSLFGLFWLAVFGFMLSRYSQEATLWAVGAGMLLLNALFMPITLGTAAAGTFQGVDDTVFSHAYQVKNAMREVASAVGISLATIILQMRSTLHYTRLVESAAHLSYGYGTAAGGADPLGLLNNPTSQALAQFANEATRQATLMACQDYFWGLCLLALATGAIVAMQRRFV